MDIVRELKRIATDICASDGNGEKWDVYEIYGNYRKKVFSVDAPYGAGENEFEKAIADEFLRQYGENLSNKSKWSWDWAGEDSLEIQYNKNGKTVWNIVKSR